MGIRTVCDLKSKQSLAQLLDMILSIHLGASIYLPNFLDPGLMQEQDCIFVSLERWGKSNKFWVWEGEWVDFWQPERRTIILIYTVYQIFLFPFPFGISFWGLLVVEWEHLSSSGLWFIFKHKWCMTFSWQEFI